MPLFLKNSGVGKVELKEGPIPIPEEGQILVKVVVAGGNPADRELNNIETLNVDSTIGFDYAGIITAVGPGVAKLSPGDRVAGLALGSVSKHLNWGAFAEYCIGFDHAAFKIPDSISFEQAATLPVGLAVASLALYQTLGIANPGSGAEKEPLLVWGGSTIMGATAVQLAKSSGLYPIIATASPRNFELLKSLGADHVIDYNDPEAVQKVKNLTDNKLTKVLDAFSGEEPSKTIDYIGKNGGTVVKLQPTTNYANTRPDVNVVLVSGSTVLGYPLKIIGHDFPAIPSNKEFFANWLTTVAEPLLNAGKLKPHRFRVIPGGLNGVQAGWDLYLQGKVSGEKLVYRIADTPGIDA